MIRAFIAHNLLLLLPVWMACGLWWDSAVSAEVQVLVDSSQMMKFLANEANPRIALDWVSRGFDDSTWSEGTYGVGYETNPDDGAEDLVTTTVPRGAFSIYTRATFTLNDVDGVANVFLGVDYDDGVVAWVNGAEVFRSPEIPAGRMAWNTVVEGHESSNGVTPDFLPLVEVSELAAPVLRNGNNVLAIGVWNDVAPDSSDLVLAPRLSVNEPNVVVRGPYLQMGTPTSVVVRWRTLLAVDSRVRYGDSPGKLQSEVVGDVDTPTTEHVILLDSLEPGRRYYYSLGTRETTLAGDDAEHFFTTAPVTGTRQRTRIWAIGDSGTANDSARAVRDAYRAVAQTSHTDLWLMLGDNAYSEGRAEQPFVAPPQ